MASLYIVKCNVVGTLPMSFQILLKNLDKTGRGILLNKKPTHSACHYIFQLIFIIPVM